MGSPEKAIILVAGMGTRLKPFTDNIPKCLTEVNGKPIIINALEKLEKSNIKETILVIGYLGDEIKKTIGNNFGNMKITYVDNPIYDKTNTSYSLWLAMKDLKENLLILEGDVFFEEKLLNDFLNHEREDLTIVEKYNPDLDGTFVELDKSNIVTDWIHKNDRSNDFVIEDKHKTVNIHKFSRTFVEEWLIPHLKKHVDENGGKSPLENVFRDIIKNQGKIQAFNAKTKWFEVDNIQDLKKAEEIFKNV